MEYTVRKDLLLVFVVLPVSSEWSCFFCCPVPSHKHTQADTTNVSNLSESIRTCANKLCLSVGSYPGGWNEDNEFMSTMLEELSYDQLSSIDFFGFKTENSMS